MHKELQLLGAQLAAPLLSDGRVFGAIVLGEKACGLAYSRTERDLVSLIARSTSMAFERAQRAHQTEARGKRLDRVLSSMDAAVVCVARDRTVTLVNPAAERLLETSAGDLIGRSVQKVGSSFADVALRAMDANAPVANAQIHERAIAKNLLLNAVPMNGDGVVVVFGQRAAETVKSDDLAQSPFWEYLAGRVAQEIKNPMVAINTFAQLLPRKYDSEDFRDAYSRVVQQEIARINAVAETLFDFSREPKPALRRIRLNDTVQEALQSFERELRARSIKLAAKWDPQIDEAEADPEYLAQAVRNVVQNAIDAMPNGGTLRIETRRDGGIAAIRIGDTGPGIRDDEASKIFLPFFSTKEQGMGLGLPIARRIAQQLHGDLKMAPRDNDGGGFEFTLPALETIHANDPGR
jgi:two-component system sensor kinase